MTGQDDEIELKRSLVKQQACFARLTDDEIQVLAELLVKKPTPKDTVITTQGDSVDSVYFIVEGTADVRLVSLKNNKIVTKSIAKLTKGQSIGLSETGFYSLSGVRTATVVAETDMLLYRLSVAEFNGFALAYPHVNAVMRQNANPA